jgi:hypothetical protein
MWGVKRCTSHERDVVGECGRDGPCRETTGRVNDFTASQLGERGRGEWAACLRLIDLGGNHEAGAYRWSWCGVARRRDAWRGPYRNLRSEVPCRWMGPMNCCRRPSTTVSPILPRASALLAVAALTASACTSSERPSSSASSSSSKSTSSPAPSPTIATSKLRGKILFTRAGGKYGDETVYSANADGSLEQRITPFGKQCCPRWFQDGTHILISALAPDGRITTRIIKPDGSNVRRIPLPKGTLNLGCTQAISLATGRLACEGWSDEDSRLGGIYTIRASDWGDLVRLTHTPGESDRPMDYSPDGSNLYFFRHVERFPRVGDELGSLFVVNADGTGLRRVTPRDMPVEVVGNSGGRLSSDGRWITFTTSGVIWKVHPDGSGLTRVFKDAQGRLAITPTWSPNGKFILFGLDPAGSVAVVESAPPNGLYVIKANGTRLTPLLVSDDWKREPDWVAGKR